MAKQRTKIPQLNKVRSILQKDIDSTCPICSSDDVEHFQIHHMDENPSNHHLDNLILICPTCHSKITKGDISRDDVKCYKLRYRDIELVSIKLLKKKCAWEYMNQNKLAVKRIESKKSINPIFSFSLINHSGRTKFFTEIQLKAIHLYSGLSGFSEAYELKTLQKYKIALPSEGITSILELEDELVIPPKRAFKIEVEVTNEHNGENYLIKTRKILRFNFKINDEIVHIPDIFLNTDSADDKVQVTVLS